MSNLDYQSQQRPPGQSTLSHGPHVSGSIARPNGEVPAVKRRSKMQAEKTAALSTSVKLEKKTMDRIPFKTGLFPLRLFFKRMDLGERQGSSLVTNGLSPRHVKIAEPMITAKILPIEDAPDRIGTVARACIDHLQRGSAEEAEALSAKLLRPEERKWLSGIAYDQSLTELQRFFARLVNGMAWANNEHCLNTCDAGFPALHLLHREMRDYMLGFRNRDSLDWKAWQYLFVATASYDLAHAVAVNALRLFSGPAPYPGNEVALGEKERAERKQKCRTALDDHLGWVETQRAQGGEFEDCLERQTVMAIRYWWNRSQLAAVADDFVEFELCFDHMVANCGGEEKRNELKQIMEDDPDTLPMVPRLKK